MSFDESIAREVSTELPEGQQGEMPKGLPPGQHGGQHGDQHGELQREPVVATKRRAFPLGYAAFAIAVILVIAEAIAISLATSGQPLLATTIGQVLVVLTALPLALGLFVAMRGPKREWGIAAMVVAVIANPLILLNVLSFFGTF